MVLEVQGAVVGCVIVGIDVEPIKRCWVLVVHLGGRVTTL